MNDLKMNIDDAVRIGHVTENAYATISCTGEIDIVGTEEEIQRCIETAPPHLKFAGDLVLEILRLRRALLVDFDRLDAARLQWILDHVTNLECTELIAGNQDRFVLPATREDIDREMSASMSKTSKPVPAVDCSAARKASGSSSTDDAKTP